MENVVNDPAIREIDSCRVCGSSNLDSVLDYGDMPLAGGFVPLDDPRARQRYPLRLVRCGQCTLMQLLDSVDPEQIFQTYSYLSSANRTLVRHFEELAAALVADHGVVGQLVVEFGCNDGILLRPLKAAGVEVVGIDPSDVAKRSSSQEGWTLYNQYLTPQLAGDIRAAHGPARVVTGNNVCAHVDDVHSLIEAVAILLDPDGSFVFEVHYQGDLLERSQFDTVYHEHVCYYSLASLAHLLKEHGLGVADVERIPTHAGSIRVTARHADRNVNVSHAVQESLTSEKAWDCLRFAERAKARRDTLRSLVTALREGNRRVVAYGASGRCTILLNFCELGDGLIDYVTDLSPLRHGRVVPGVLIPVVDRESFRQDDPEFAILTAWNYQEEIVLDEQAYLEGGGRFIVPLPEVSLVAQC